MKKFLLALSMVVVALLGIAVPTLIVKDNAKLATYTITAEVSTFEELKNALLNQENTLIKINGDIEVAETLTTGVASYSLVSTVDATVKRVEGFTGDIFYISSGAKVSVGEADALYTLAIDGNGEVVTESEGSLFDNRGSLTLLDGVILQNNTSITSGSAIYNRSECTIDGAIITNNKIPVEKIYGTIYNANMSKLYLISGEVCNNKTAVSGCGMFLSANSAFEMTGGKIYGNVVEFGNGGAICAKGTNVTITGGEIYSNSSTQGAGIYAYDGAVLNLSSVKIYSNEATRGAGIGVTNATLNADNIEVVGNTATNEGAGFYFNKEDDVSSVAIITDSVIKNNTTTKVNSGDNWAYGGAGLKLKGGADVTIRGTEISNNSADRGAGIYVEEDCVLKLEGSKLSSNSATQGGAIHMLKSVVTLDTTNIYNNTANYGAGVRINNGGKLIFNSGNICYNVSEASGCAIFNNEGIFIMNGGALSFNQVKLNNGGAINNKSTVIINGGTIEGNTGTARGGAIYSYEDTASVTINGGKFINNGKILTIDSESATVSDSSASTYGGAISATAGSLKINGGEFEGNAVSNNGGAIHVNGAMLTITDGKFTYNSSTGNGGALYIANTTATISGGTFTSNAGAQGGAVTIDYGAEVTITGGTFQGNTSTNTGNAKRGDDVYVVDSKGKEAKDYPHPILTITGGNYDIIGNQYSTIKIGGNVTVTDHIKFWAGVQADFAYLEIIEDLEREIVVKPQSNAEETTSSNQLVRLNAEIRKSPYQWISKINIAGYYLRLEDGLALRTKCDNHIKITSPVAIDVQLGANEGETVSFRVLNGYQISNVKMNGADVLESEGVYSFTMPAQEVSITYDYELTNLPIAINENARGLLDLAESAKLGTEVEVSLADGSDYRVTGVYFIFNEKRIDLDYNDGIYAFIMFEGVELNVDKVPLYNVRFEENQYLADESKITFNGKEEAYLAEGDEFEIYIESINTRYIIDFENSYYTIGMDEEKHYLTTTNVIMPSDDVVFTIVINDIYEHYQNTVEVNNFQELKTALETVGGELDIVVNQDIEITNTIMVAKGEFNIVPVGERTIKRAVGFTESLFILEEDCVLNLGVPNSTDLVNTLTVDGNKQNVKNIVGSLVTILYSSKLYINPMVTLRNNHVTANYIKTKYGIGGTSVSGSAIYNYSGEVYLNGGVITKNSATKVGGAIYNYGYVEINGGEISYNTTFSHGGAIYSIRNVTMNGGTVAYNTAGGSASNAGAIYIANSSYSLFRMYGGEISYNTAVGSAGAVYIGSKATAIIDRGSFIGNITSTGNGGAIYLYGKAIVRNVYCEANIAAGNGKSGGAIYINTSSSATINGNAHIDGGTFINNQAYNGGAIALNSQATLNITENTVIFSGNMASNRGGAIYLASAEGKGHSTAIITSASMNGNIATKGGDIAVQYGILEIGGNVEVNSITFVAEPRSNYGYLSVVENLNNKITVTPNTYKNYSTDKNNFIRLASGVDVYNVIEKVSITPKSGMAWELNNIGGQLYLQSRQYSIAIADGLAKVVDIVSNANEGQIVSIKPLSGYRISNVMVDGEGVQNSSFVMPNKDVVVSYDYEAVEYLVYVDETIKNGEVSVDKDTATVEDQVTINVTPNEGYYTKKLVINGESVKVADSIVINVTGIIYVEATFEKCKFMVGFNYNYGRKSKIKTVEYGTLLKEETPTREGYTFEGWYTDKELTEKFSFDVAITEVTQLYAKWTKVQ